MLDLNDRTPLKNEVFDHLATKGGFCKQDINFQTCTSCLMDTTDPEIEFSRNGICNYCSSSNSWQFVRPDGNPQDSAIEKMINDIKRDSMGLEFDCIIGISGGVDSSYLALMAKEWTLNPLFVHVDAGWNSNVANSNIHKIIEFNKAQLVTVVIDWNKMKNSQNAFLRSGLANQDIPQDYVFTKSVFQIAKNFKIRHLLSGSNMSTESVLPRQWGYDALDVKHIKAIHSNFLRDGEIGIDIDFQPLTLNTLYRRDSLQVHKPLNYLPYSRNLATNTLKEIIDWQEYGPKHFESRWTRYFQGYLLIYRFGYDKRKAHLSSRIISGELSRQQALKEFDQSQYPIENLLQDEAFISNKLGISRKSFLDLKDIPLSHYTDFNNNEMFRQKLGAVRSIAAKIMKI